MTESRVQQVESARRGYELWPNFSVIVCNNREFLAASGTQNQMAATNLDTFNLPRRVFEISSVETLGSIPIVGTMKSDSVIDLYVQDVPHTKFVNQTNLVYLESYGTSGDIIDISRFEDSVESIIQKVVDTGTLLPDQNIEDLVLPGELSKLNELLVSSTGLDIYQTARAVSEFCWREALGRDDLASNNINAVEYVRRKREKVLINALNIDIVSAKFIFSMLGDYYSEVISEFEVLKNLDSQLLDDYRSSLQDGRNSRTIESRNRRKLLLGEFIRSQVKLALGMGLPIQLANNAEIAREVGYANPDIANIVNDAIDAWLLNNPNSDGITSVERARIIQEQLSVIKRAEERTHKKYDGLSLESYILRQFMLYKSGELSAKDVNTIPELKEMFETNQITIRRIIDSSILLQEIETEVRQASRSENAVETLIRSREGNGIKIGDTTYSSAQEYMIARLLEKFIPDFKIQKGVNYQVPVKDENGRTKLVDFAFAYGGKLHVIEFHSNWWCLLKGIDPEDYFQSRELLAKSLYEGSGNSDGYGFLGSSLISEVIDYLRGINPENAELNSGEIDYLLSQFDRLRTRLDRVHLINEFFKSKWDVNACSLVGSLFQNIATCRVN